MWRHSFNLLISGTVSYFHLDDRKMQGVNHRHMKHSEGDIDVERSFLCKGRRSLTEEDCGSLSVLPGIRRRHEVRVIMKLFYLSKVVMLVHFL